MVKGCVVAGGAGVSIGRNAFQHRDPEKIIRVINKLVHDGCSVEDGLIEMAA
jgi:class I fructose-bisphosphate aldolase